MPYAFLTHHRSILGSGPLTDQALPTMWYSRWAFPVLRRLRLRGTVEVDVITDNICPQGE
jgi:hypothetical protein